MTGETAAALLAIVGGTVIPVSSPDVSGGTVLVRDGRIEAVGSDVAVPDETEVVDATGKWVLPGWVDPHAHVGVHEERTGTSGEDANETSSSVMMPGLRVLDGIDIEDLGFRDALEGGVTTIVVKPGSTNVFGGQCVAVKAAGGPTVDQRVVSDRVSVKSGLGENPKSGGGSPGDAPTTRMGVAHLIRQALTDARHRGAGGKAPPDLHAEALDRLLAGELAWDVHAHRQDDIATALRIAQEFGLRLVINHGTEAYKLLDEISAIRAPVVLGPLFSAPQKVEQSGWRKDTAAVLHRAGITVALMTDHPQVPLHLLASEAAFAMREGLPREAALRSITMNPAAIYGLDDRVGALAPGLDADIVLWSHDPFDARARVERVVIDGRTVFTRGDEVPSA